VPFPACEEPIPAPRRGAFGPHSSGRLAGRLSFQRLRLASRHGSETLRAPLALANTVGV